MQSTSVSEGLERDVLYRFGSFQLDPAERSLRRGQESVSLTPKAFDTLCVLVENSGRLVTKDQLLDKIWPETYVEEKTLAQNIFTLRKALGNDPEGHNYIETVSKQGYRFSPNVFRFSRTSEEFVDQREQQTEVIIEEEIETDVPDRFELCNSQDHAPALSANTNPQRGGFAGTGRTFFNARRLSVVALVVTGLGALFLGSQFAGRSIWSRPPSFSEVKINKLTNSGDVGPMSLSPDGKYVVYVKRGPGQQSLVVRQTNSSSALEIVPPAKTAFIGASFSPDGTTIYYVARAYGSDVGTAYRIPLLGGTPTEVIDDVDTPVAVSPDGKQLAFVRNVPHKNERHLVIAGNNGKEERVLAATTPDFSFGLYSPSWSPDQKMIAVATVGLRGTANTFGIGLVDTQSGSIQPFGKSGWRWVGQIAWLPRGDELVVTAAAAADPSLSDQIWILSYPSGDARRVTNDVNGLFGIGVSRDSSTIASVVSNRNGTFWIVEGNDLSTARQIRRNSGDRMAPVLGLSWTSDDRLLYSSQASDGAEIWTMKPDGSQQRQLTFDGGPNTAPLATSDGKYIVYLAQRDGQRVLARIGADGSNTKDLARVGGIGFSITPDSKWIIYSSLRDDKPALFKISIDGGEPTLLSPATAIFPAVSPDGKFIACYVVSPDRKRRLSIISFGTGEIAKQFDVYLEYDLATIRWEPDSKAITYVVSTNGVSNIWRQPINGGAPEQFTKWNSDVIFRFDWSKDNRLAVERGMFTNDVVLIRAENE